MNRRELLRMIAIATGGTVIGAEFFLTGCKNPQRDETLLFTEDDIVFLDEVAETILPQTSTAGAKAAGVGQFMTVWVNDCYSKEDQEIFHRGMDQLNEACKKMHSHDFLKSSPEQKKELLTVLDKETKEYNEKKVEFDKLQLEKAKQESEKGNPNYEMDKMPNHYFQQIKQLTIFGYFTSEKGRKESLRYVPVPGKWEAVIDYKKGDKAFAGIA